MLPLFEFLFRDFTLTLGFVSLLLHTTNQIPETILLLGGWVRCSMWFMYKRCEWNTICLTATRCDNAWRAQHLHNLQIPTSKSCMHINWIITAINGLRIEERHCLLSVKHSVKLNTEWIQFSDKSHSFMRISQQLFVYKLTSLDPSSRREVTRFRNKTKYPLEETRTAAHLLLFHIGNSRLAFEKNWDFLFLTQRRVRGDAAFHTHTESRRQEAL